MWRKEPKSIADIPKGIDFVLFADENGHVDLKNIKNILNNKKDIDKNIDIGDKVFTLTSCAMSIDEVIKFRENITLLKHNYWHNGSFYYKGDEKRICFHSRDIRKKNYPFYFEGTNDFDFFINDLSSLISNTNFTIISCNIDKVKLCERYVNPYDPYVIALEFLFERFYFFLKQRNGKGIIMLESRGKKEDKCLHKKAVDLYNNGNNYLNSDCFKKHFEGVYFNPKWNKDGLSYFGLELADLCSHPIHSFARSNQQNKAFKSLKNKIYSYPNYMHKGLKIFP